MDEHVSPLAGKPAPPEMLVNLDQLREQYYSLHPDSGDPGQQVRFGTSGHRGTSAKASFNEDHIAAISQAVAEYRAGAGITGPLYIGKDSHALSEPAEQTALEVLAANGVEVYIAGTDPFTPTPVISHAILTYNRGRKDGLADGIVITPSHNPPADGGYKYNPPSGGPAEPDVTGWIQNRANALIAGGLREVKRMPYEQARRAATTHLYDFVSPYVADLGSVIDMEAIRLSGISIGADPLGGASLGYWGRIGDDYGLNLTVVNKRLDMTFSFVPVDWDGKIRMDCSSPYAMASLVDLKDRYDIAFGNDTDADRHGVVTPSNGLLNPNHYLSVAIWYLFQHRPNWPREAAIGKTLVSSAMIDRVGAAIGRQVYEVPVGFKWFVEGLLSGSLGFGGEESAGASFQRLDGSTWTTDKDGIILNLLAAEITAVTQSDPGQHYQRLTEELGTAYYSRVDSPASREAKAALGKLSPEQVSAGELAGDPITARLTKAPGNNADIGGLKVVTANGWFAARPSGTEDINKIYAESFVSQDHLQRILTEAEQIVRQATNGR